eukprot:3425152-Rhodomonas_salina.4
MRLALVRVASALAVPAQCSAVCGARGAGVASQPLLYERSVTGLVALTRCGLVEPGSTAHVRVRVETAGEERWRARCSARIAHAAMLSTYADVLRCPALTQRMVRWHVPAHVVPAYACSTSVFGSRVLCYLPNLVGY